MAEFQWPLRVYIEDTDAGGIVYYVNYLKFMERARTEYMRALGYGKTSIFSDNLMFVVHSMQVDYKKPARLDDELVATAEVVKTGRAYLLFHQEVRNGSQLLCSASVKIACVDRAELRPAPLPQVMLQQVKQQRVN